METPAEGRGRSILAVVDNRAVAELSAALLGLDGYAVRTAFDGLEALKAGETFRPEVVLMDLALPGLDGHGDATRMGQQPWGRGAVLIALTGWAEEQDRRRARDAGFDRHLVKTVANHDLLALLATP